MTIFLNSDFELPELNQSSEICDRSYRNVLINYYYSFKRVWGFVGLPSAMAQGTFWFRRSHSRRPWGNSNKTHLSLLTKGISKNNADRKRKSIENKWRRGGSMRRSESGKEPADLEKSWRKVIFNPRLENNFPFPQISLKNLLLSELGRFIQINGL